MKQFGFWKYDQFPFCDGSAGELREDNRFYPDIWAGSFVRPFLVVDDVDAGGELYDQLQELARTRRLVIDSLEEGFRKSVDRIIKLPK